MDDTASLPSEDKQENCFATGVVILRWEIKAIKNKNNLDLVDATSYLKGLL